MAHIARDELLEWFRYEPDTGNVYWRKRPAIGGGSAKVGDLAGSVLNRASLSPRRILWLRRSRIAVSRAAYIMTHGDIPPAALIDHADGDTLNNRIENLRLASAAQNTWNRIGAGSSAKGVSKDARGRFKARISVPGGKINLGTWDTEAEAHAAYMGAAAILHGEFWLGGRQTSPKAKMAVSVQRPSITVRNRTESEQNAG
jgi:hypothetical protein